MIESRSVAIPSCSEAFEFLSERPYSAHDIYNGYTILQECIEYQRLG